MRDNDHFQTVCTTCGCLSIKIEEPLKSSRDAIVYCGDCGTSRGTVGALRDLAVRRSPEIGFPDPSLAFSPSECAADEPQPTTKISTQYAELRRLRQQVKIAEWLASESQRAHPTNRLRKTDARHFALGPAPKAKRTYIGDERDQKRPG